MKRSFFSEGRTRVGGHAKSPRNTARVRMWSPLALLCAPAWLLCVTSSSPAAAHDGLGGPLLLASTSVAGAVNKIDGLTLEEHEDGTTVLRLRGSAKPTFNVYRLQEPDRLVVDIASSERGEVVPRLPLDTWAASRVTVDDVRERDAELVRVVVELKREVSYIVVPDGTQLVVTVTPRQMPPEAYFDRKSASERQAEIEAKARNVERMHRDASALKAEAKALGAQATARARATESDAKAAEARAIAAKQAETAAREAEAAAKRAEARATEALSKALTDEKNSRFGARRLRRQAQAEMDRAKAERAEAQRVRQRAHAELERALAQAESRRGEADAAATRARQAKEQAERMLADARAQAKQTETRAAQKLASAAQTEAKARQTLASANAFAKKTQQEAQQKLAEARARAQRAESDARAKLASAQAAGDKAEQVAREKLAAAQAEARRAKADAAAARRAAKAADADAARRLEQARVAAEARQASAERDVERAQQAAKQAQAEAARRLAQARGAVHDAQQRADEIIAAARAQAETTLALAKKRADEEVATAKVRASVEAKQTLGEAQAQARALLEEARADADDEARRRIAAATKAADEKVARAQTQARERARAQIRQAELEAGRKLARAQADAEQQTIAAAQQELARVRSQAQARIAKEVEAAREQARAQAKKDIAEARARAREDADARVARAQARAKAVEAEASKTLAHAQKEASSKLAAAENMRKEAEEALSNAARAMQEAEAEKQASMADRRHAEQTLAAVKRKASAADAARKEAEEALAKAAHAMAQAKDEKNASEADRRRAAQVVADAKREASAAQKRGEDTAAQVARARRQRDDAIARNEQAQRDIAKLRVDHDRLEAKLKQRRALAEQLDGKIAAKERRLSQMEAEVVAARTKLEALGGSASQRELEEARAQALRVQATATVLEKEVKRLEDAAKEAGGRAAKAEARLAQLERSGARQQQLEAARADLHSARRQASAAKEDVSKRTRKLQEVTSLLQQRQEEVGGLERRRAELSEQGKTLQAQNAAARKRLTQAETELKALQASVEAERGKLAKVEGDVAQARTVLDERLTAVQERERRLGDQRRAETLARKTKAHAKATVRDVRFERGAQADRVVISYDGPLRYDGRSLTPNIQMLELPGAQVAKALERSLDASAYDGPVKRVTSFNEGDVAKVVVSTHGPSSPRLEEREGELVWHFAHELSRRPPSGTDVVSMAGSKVGGFASAPRSTALLAQPPGEGSLAEPPEAVTTRRTRFRGERIDIELQDAPIKDVLLLFSDIGRVNIIAGRGVDGSVTMKLNAVPWDQALDIILRSLNLGSVREGNVIRVATLDDLEAERRAAIERANARVQLKPLETRLMPVSYATVGEMVPKVQSVLSPRGQVTPDARTNTLIIMDIAENIALAEQLVRSLDTQTPQVLIEARIVEARTNFTRQLGIQWGFDYIASPGTGNPTGLLFPNSVGVGGGGTGLPADTRGLILPAAAANPNYAVDLPAPVGTRQGGAIGFSFGSISGNLNTNLRLSAAETTGEVRIISAPKIVTLDNSEAQIEQGVQIPISQVSAQGVNTRFVRATLSLQVTPHVTAEGAVLLDVIVQKNEADFINTGARGDPTILTKQAQSRMLVNDSDTAVIGGIYSRNKAVNFAKIPWIADIPILGWFFKNKSEADTRSEVLIFLTPKIVNRAASIGG
jgi:type IV pilus assembly protein PilQ